MQNYTPPSEKSSQHEKDLETVRAYNLKRRFSLGNITSASGSTSAAASTMCDDLFTGWTRYPPPMGYPTAPHYPQQPASNSSQLFPIDNNNNQLNEQRKLVSNSAYSRMLYEQQQQQQQQEQQQQQINQLSQENLSNFLKLCNNYSGVEPYGSDLTNMDSFNAADTASMSSSLSSLPGTGLQTPYYLNQQSPLNSANMSKLGAGFRRRSYEPSIFSSQLKPVLESPRSVSPVYSYKEPSNNQSLYQDKFITAATAMAVKQQQQQLIEQRLNLLINAGYLTGNNNAKPLMQKSIHPTRRSFSSACSSLDSSLASSGTPSSATNSSLNLTQSGSVSPKLLPFASNPCDEKLATTGNIFQRREDWMSLLAKIPISKQNTIHIRLEDEGPYGNDETRCFVLSHFSSLKIKEMSCVFCNCQLVLYDRFPLVDGTLFLSPVCYSKEKSISAIVDKKQSFINALCLSCLLGSDSTHEIVCRFCKTSLQSLGATSLQIGTLYKFDLFAAFPCCSKRFECLKCHQVISSDIEQQNYFSSFSDEKECCKCKSRAHHMIKPLDDIYVKSKCFEKSK